MANEIKEIRKKINLTQVELAKLIDVSQPRISRLEKQKTITIELLRKIAEKLGVSIKDLL